jgi:hypothetical protein
MRTPGVRPRMDDSVAPSVDQYFLCSGLARRVTSLPSACGQEHVISVHGKVNHCTPSKIFSRVYCTVYGDWTLSSRVTHNSL